MDLNDSVDFALNPHPIRTLAAQPSADEATAFSVYPVFHDLIVDEALKEYLEETDSDSTPL